MQAGSFWRMESFCDGVGIRCLSGSQIDLFHEKQVQIDKAVEEIKAFGHMCLRSKCAVSQTFPPSLATDLEQTRIAYL